MLLDEPLTNLDAKLRHDMRAEFKRLHRELGTTMLYATPDELEALGMGERIGVLRDGRIVQTGSPDELYEHPVNTYVGQMVGSPKMNLAPGSTATAPASPPRSRISRGDRGQPPSPSFRPAPSCSSGSGPTTSGRPRARRGGHDSRPACT